MVRRAMGAVVIAVGVVLIVTTLANDLFDVGPAFEELTGDFGPIMTDESLAALQADLQGIGGVPGEFNEALAPAIAEQLGMSRADLDQMVAGEFPQVAAGLQALPELGPRFQGLVQILVDQQENFEGADGIPISALPATTVPWGLLIVGIIAILIGLLMFLRDDRVGPILAVGFGLVVIIGSFAVSLPAKAKDADDLNEGVKDVYTAETIAGGEQGLAVLGGMGTQMQSEMLPAMAQQLGMSDEQMLGFLGANFPNVAAALQSLPDAMGRFTGLIDAFAANLDNFRILEPVAFSPIIWTLIVGSAVMAAAGVIALVLGRRKRPAAEPPPAAA